MYLLLGSTLLRCGFLGSRIGFLFGIFFCSFLIVRFNRYPMRQDCNGMASYLGTRPGNFLWLFVPLAGLCLRFLFGFEQPIRLGLCRSEEYHMLSSYSWLSLVSL